MPIARRHRRDAWFRRRGRAFDRRFGPGGSRQNWPSCTMSLERLRAGATRRSRARRRDGPSTGLQRHAAYSL